MTRKNGAIDIARIPRSTPAADPDIRDDKYERDALGWARLFCADCDALGEN
jgi:hypothetical protein